jgi:hypothetical protein
MHSDRSTREFKLAWLLVVGVAVFAVVYRVVPYLFNLSPAARYVWNLTPVGALGLFAGARLRSHLAFLVPLLVMLASDALLWKPLTDRGFPAFTWYTPAIYASIVLYVLFGRLVRDTSSPLWVGGTSLVASLQFFVVTNFAVWLFGPMEAEYPKTLAGLLLCYWKAIPFFGNTVAGDLLYSGLCFGLYGLAVTAAQRREASQPA